MTNATEKLYWADATALSFETNGARLVKTSERPALVLAQTMFYPEGGGQLGDAGTLLLGNCEVNVVDTQIEDGVIHHVLDADLPEPLANALASVTIQGRVDETRRRDHMIQHTAQHALSRALADAAKAETVSARLGLGSCTIDISRPGLPDADLHRAEDLVNAVLLSDVPVTTAFPTAEELAKLPLRKQPNAEKSAAGVRIVTIENFDVTPCGGTHVSRTGQIGQIRITGAEKYKGMLRLSFHAGRRALDGARADHAALDAIARDLTCGPKDIAAAIAKLRSETKSLRDKLEASRGELAELVSKKLLAALPEDSVIHVIPALRPLDDLAALRALAIELAKDPRVVALVGGHDEGSGELVLVVQRGAAAKLDCGAFVMTQAKARSGRGGGRPERAEGRFPRGTSLEILVIEARAARDVVA